MSDAIEVHPAALVTLKVCVPAVSPVIVLLVPVPVLVVPLEVSVNVQIPVDGKQLKITLPVAIAHVG